MVQYINPTTFQYNLQQGQTPQGRGYPTVWQKPHWHGDNTYNPHLRTLLNEPDGTRIYWDPVTTTYSTEHSSGYHHAVTTDSIIENVPTRKHTFIGGGGESHTVCGHQDITYGGHVRQNYQCDHYENYKGVHHGFYQQGQVSCNMGNATHEHYGNVKHRVLGQNGSWGVGVGPGNGQVHDSNQSMTNMRIATHQTGQGDMVQQTTSNNITVNSGMSHIINTQQNHTTNAGNMINHLAQSNVNIQSNSSNILVNTTQDIHLNAGGMIFANGNFVIGAYQQENVQGDQGAKLQS